ncbi:MAG: hypothetical protein K2G45_01270 [Lachnospiraceae bacterium]|nr:hypothetical protein [Lachnospiraceae bacterium]
MENRMKRYNFIYQMDLPHRAVSVYIYLAERTAKEGKCWLAVPTIVRKGNSAFMVAGGTGHDGRRM